MTQDCAAARKPGRDFIWAGLLASTALIAPGSVTPARAQDAIALEPITVETSKEKGDGPVKGYVATESTAATKTDTPLAETPMTVNVVGSEQMADQGAQSVAEALRYVPNIQGEYRGTSNLHDEIMIRGFTSYANKSLDGMTFGGASNGQLDPYLLDRVEVVKGPSSITYGQVAPGGQINQSLKLPTEAQGNQAEIAVGTDDYYRLSADLQGNLDDEGRLRYRLVTSAWQKTLQGDLDQNRILVAPSLTWDLSDRTSFTVYGIYQREPDAGYRNHQTLGGTLEPSSAGYWYPDGFVSYAPDYDEASRTTASVGYRLEHAFDNGLTLHHSLRYNYINLHHKGLSGDYVDDAGTGVVLFGFQSDDKTNQLTSDTYLSAEALTGGIRHKLVLGVDTQWTETRSKYSYAGDVATWDFATGSIIGGLGPVSLSQRYDKLTELTQTGIYAQDQMEIGNWRLLLGLRHDWTNTKVKDGVTRALSEEYDDTATTGRAALAYRFGNGVMPYVSYSTSFTPSTRLDPDGTASFKPETAEQWEVGLKWATADERMQIAAAAFDITQDGVVEYISGIGYQQVGKVRTKGYELEFRGDVTDNLTVLASYAHLDPELKEGANAGMQQQRVPVETASLWVKYGFAPGWHASAGMRHIGHSWGDADNTIKVPSVTLFDLGLEADLGSFSSQLDGAVARIAVTNAGDKRYTASCANGGYCWQGEGRVITASLSYAW